MATTASAEDRKKSLEKVKSDLPPDWQLVETDGKKPYFWNTKTGKTSWKFPAAEGKKYKRVHQILFLIPRCVGVTPQLIALAETYPSVVCKFHDVHYLCVNCVVYSKGYDLTVMLCFVPPQLRHTKQW